MKGRVIVLDLSRAGAPMAALIVDGRLEDLLVDPPEARRTPAPGEIYRARVDRLAAGIGGAFVRLAPDQQGFLREGKGVKQGQDILVQVTSYAEPGKATPVTTRLLYKGRLVIHTPGAPGINVSRRIRDADERARLARAVEDWPSATAIGEPARRQLTDLHGSGGFILRSAAAGIDAATIGDHVAAVLDMRWQREAPSAPAAPVEGPARQHATHTALREWAGEPPDAVVLGTALEACLRDPALAATHGLDPELLGICRVSRTDPFDHFGVWDEIARLGTPRTDLPSGGWIAVEATRAMVTVDVNTADGFGGGDAATANIEAAREIPRQLRLRGLGGQVAIDFAPLKKMHRKRVEEELGRAFRRDPVETALAGWTPLGNFELTRKRERRPLADLLD